jgi:hypothetical protein
VSAPSDSLAERYGAPPAWRRPLLIAIVVVVVGALAALWTWITVVQSDPKVSSELITSKIVDDHTATAVVRVQWGDGPVDAQCTVRAIAEDKTVVGEATFAPKAGDNEVSVSTERRATALDNIGCTADGQRRPR